MSSRRHFFRSLGLGSSMLAIPAGLPFSKGSQPGISDRNDPIVKKVFETSFVDTHEHLPDEPERLRAGTMFREKVNDWTLIASHYLDADLRVAGMDPETYEQFFNHTGDPEAKWDLWAPYWEAVRHTGYARAVRIAVRLIYDVPDLEKAYINRIQDEYEKTVRPGFYKRILKDLGGIESCQVNSYPVLKSVMPDFLMTDIWVNQLITDPGNNRYAEEAGIDVKDLNDWHRVIDWWFKTYGPYAVGIKVSNAYERNIDFIPTPPEKVRPIISRKLNGEQVSKNEQKMVEDHLFWYTVEQATRYDLPVKIHTGYYAQWQGKSDRMPLERVRNNPSAACLLCDHAPDTKFIFFHISYPYYEEMIALAKQYPNAYMDMCWAWILNPVASKDFLKKFLVSVPANKILTFGGDYMPVEPVAGHAGMARQGIAAALNDLVNEGWMKREEALSVTDPVMHGNAENLFRLEEKSRRLKNLNWAEI